MLGIVLKHFVYVGFLMFHMQLSRNNNELEASTWFILYMWPHLAWENHDKRQVLIVGSLAFNTL